MNVSVGHAIRTPSFIKEELPVPFYSLSSPSWDSLYQTMPEELHAPLTQPDLSDAIWDVPIHGIESPSSVRPGLTHENSFEELHTISSSSIQTANEWSDQAYPKSRSASQECESIAKREKRRQQNRRAQQAYRQRKDQQISSMEQELRQLRQAYKTLKEEHQQLLGQLTAVKVALA